MDISDAKLVLFKMEEQIRNRLCSDANEPECEVHSSAQSSNCADLQEHLDDICSLRDLFVKQSQTLSMLQEHQPETGEREPCPIPAFVSSIPDPDDFSASSILDQPEARKDNKSFEETVEEATKSLDDAIFKTLQEISPTCVSKLHSKRLFADDAKKTHDLYGSDSDIDSLFPDFDVTDSEIQDAINEIRKEASQMDAIMALDQLKTIQSELEVATKTLQERSTEAEDLRIQVEEMEERVACLELERDLFKADAAKLKEDLKTCVERMFDISCVVGDSNMSDFDRDEIKSQLRDPPMMSSTSEKSKQAEIFFKPPNIMIEHAHPSIPSSKPDSAAPTLFFAPKDSREVIRRTPTTSDPSPARRVLLESSRRPQSRGSISQRDSIFRRADSFRHPGPVSAQSSGSSIDSTRVESQPPKRRHRSFSVERSRQTVNETEGKENRMCGIFRRRNSRRLSSFKANDIEIMRQQIGQLHTMMKTSLSTSEKLRKRLAMISRYYEGIIRKLQEQVVETKTERKRMEVQLANQISTIDHEKRVTMMQLEMKLRRKDEEIARLRRMEI
jgi:hypothetical protein